MSSFQKLRSQMTKKNLMKHNSKIESSQIVLKLNIIRFDILRKKKLNFFDWEQLYYELLLTTN